MDREDLVKLKELLDRLVPDGEEPAAEDLDDDDDAIAMYHSMAQLWRDMTNYGF